MGTSLSSVQVHLGNKPKTDTRTSVIDALRRHVLERGFVETNPAEEHDPDRTVLIGPVGATPWLTVIDTQGNMRELAKYLSTVVDGAAVFINLLHSDVMHLRLYQAGDLVDDYCNAPDDYNSYEGNPDRMADWGDLSKSQLKARTRGHLAKWRGLFVEGTDTKTLRAVWSSHPVFADDILWATAGALGMDSKEIGSTGDILWATVYAPGMNAEEIASMGEAENFTRLTFRLSKPPAYKVKAAGLPEFSLAGRSEPSRVYVSDTFELTVSIQNDGGAGTGMDIVAWGSVLDNGVLKLTSANIQSPDRPLDPLVVDFEPSHGKVGDQEITSLLARLDGLKLPQGLADGHPVGMQPGIDPQKAYHARLLTQIRTQIHGSVERTGGGDLFVAFIPHDNRTQGQTVYQASLQALPVARRPLRYRQATRGISPAVLEQLATPRHLFALIALDTDRVPAATLAADVLQAWAAEMAQRSGKALVTRLRPRLDSMPDKKRLPVGEATDSAYWSALREALETCVSFSVEAPLAQIIFDVDSVSFQHSREEPAPQLGIFYTLEKAGDDANQSVENRLVEIVDQLMGTEAIAQALVGRWDWGPYPSLYMTPYEVASGVNGQCTTARFWCKRYVRGVTEKLWLGPEMIAQLGGIDQLTPIAQVIPVRNGVRILLKEGSTLDQLELALAPLLPGEKEWREGMGRLYQRQ